MQAIQASKPEVHPRGGMNCEILAGAKLGRGCTRERGDEPAHEGTTLQQPRGHPCAREGSRAPLISPLSTETSLNAIGSLCDVARCILGRGEESNCVSTTLNTTGAYPRARGNHSSGISSIILMRCIPRARGGTQRLEEIAQSKCILAHGEEPRGTFQQE
jgi:hypothetical protein